MPIVHETSIGSRNLVVYTCPECGEIFPIHHLTTSHCPMCQTHIEPAAFWGRDYWLLYLAGGFFAIALSIMLTITVL